MRVIVWGSDDRGGRWLRRFAGCCAVGGVCFGLAAGGAGGNPVGAENSLRGDSGWGSGSSKTSGLEGYASSVSVLPGGRLGFQVSAAPGLHYRIEIYRLGWYGGLGGRQVACLPSCSGSRLGVQQPRAPAPDAATGVVDAGWSTTDTLAVGREWISGYYLARFRVTSGSRAGQSSWYPFIVLPPPDRRASILVQVPVNTWQAYNAWGGKSLYDYNSTGGVRARKVSFDRPLQGDNQPVFAWEYPVVRFLERNGYDVAYTTNVDTDRDPAQLGRYPLVVSLGHDEYWTRATRDGFDAARDSGHNLIFMGADSADWQVRYENGDRTLVGYKDRSDPIANPQTVRFRDLVPARPQCSLLGVEYQGGRVPGGVAPFGLNNYAVVGASTTDPWMQGTGFAAGQTLRHLVGYEWDGLVAGCIPSPTVFFKYLGPPSAEAVRYAAPSGARVFSTGSLQFAWGLDAFDANHHGNLVDPRLEQFMLNVLDDLAPHSRGSPPIGPPVTSQPHGGEGAGTNVRGSGAPPLTAVKLIKIVVRGNGSLAISLVNRNPFAVTGRVVVSSAKPLTATRRARRRPLLLGSKGFKAAGGQRIVVRLRMARRALRTLRRVKKLRARIVVGTAGPSGAKRTTSRTVLLAPRTRH